MEGTALWSSLRLSVGSFLADLERQGAFYDHFVTCDATTTTPTDIDNGVVNIVVGIAPLKPAELIVLRIQQLAGGTAGLDNPYKGGRGMPTNTEFPKATYRYDPYRNFKFRLKWDGKYVAGFSKVSALADSPTLRICSSSSATPAVPAPDTAW